MKRILILLQLTVSFQLSAFAQGLLTPPGAPAPTMKTLAQVEPRTLISSAPYTITASGSYYLTTNITCVACTNSLRGIYIQADGVTLDFNGFELVGVPGSLEGVWAFGSHTNIAIRNGSVRNWGSNGIDLYSGPSVNCQIDRMLVANNGGNGIAAWTGITATHCTSQGNTYQGFIIGPDSAVIDCIARGNGAVGISVGDGSRVVDCLSSTNGGTGIQLSDYCMVKHCIARANASDGMSAGSGCTIVECTVGLNAFNGLETADGNTISICTIRSNGRNGIVAGSSNRIVDNLCDFNARANGGTNGYSSIQLGGRANRAEGNHIHMSFGANVGIASSTGDNVVIRNSVVDSLQPFLFGGINFAGFPVNLNYVDGGVDAGGIITNKFTDPNFYTY